MPPQPPQDSSRESPPRPAPLSVSAGTFQQHLNLLPASPFLKQKKAPSASRSCAAPSLSPSCLHLLHHLPGLQLSSGFPAAPHRRTLPWGSREWPAFFATAGPPSWSSRPWTSGAHIFFPPLWTSHPHTLCRLFSSSPFPGRSEARLVSHPTHSALVPRPMAPAALRMVSDGCARNLPQPRRWSGKDGSILLYPSKSCPWSNN